MRSIPLIDISPLSIHNQASYGEIGKQLRHAAQHHGFFYIKGHGISEQIIQSAFDIAKQFFSLSESEKSSVKVSKTHRGYLRIGESTMEGYSIADRKESFIWGLDLAEDTTYSEPGNQMLAANRWPCILPHMKETLNAYFGAAHECAFKILGALAVSLDLDRNFFTRNFSMPTSRGSLIYYPELSQKKTQYGVSPHTDFGCLSLLAQNDSGLRVQTADGEWLPVQPIPETFIVNIGDLLARWTNDRFRSVPHCVVNENQEPRYSIVVFVDPDSYTLIDPIILDGDKPIYEPIACNAYINARFNRSFSYRHET